MHFFSFGCIWETIWLLHKTRCKIGQPGAIKAEVRATKSRQKFSNECSRSTYWTLISCFHAFLSIWVHLGPFRDHTKLKAKRAKLVQLMQKFVPWCPVTIFTTNTPDPHHWTPISCFGTFLSIYVHLGPFRYCTKLGAKWANLVQLKQKFVPQCLVRISQNERSWSI